MNCLIKIDAFWYLEHTHRLKIGSGKSSSSFLRKCCFLMKNDGFSWKNLNFRKFSKKLKKSKIWKKIIKLQIALKIAIFELWSNKKYCNEIFYQRLHFQKNLGRARTSARGARQNPLCWETFENQRFLALMAEYSTGARAEVRARQKFCHHHNLHKISYHPDTLIVFISLELASINDFEVGAFLVPNMHRIGK